MSFNITLMTTKSPVNKLDKELKTIASMQGDLKNECDILHPVVLLDVSANLSKCNYMHIEEFGRYYYIESMEYIRDSIVSVQAHVDVLMTFKEQIRENTAIILRQENDFNLLMNDGVFKCQQDLRIYQRDFPNGFEDFNYVLIVAGG